jgi:hypothetical protein
MLDAFFLKKLLYLKILEFKSIVASDLFHFELKLIWSSPYEAISVPWVSVLSCKRIPK